MDRVYDELRKLSIEHLERMWKEADPYSAFGVLLRSQIDYTRDKKIAGLW